MRKLNRVDKKLTEIRNLLLQAEHDAIEFQLLQNKLNDAKQEMRWLEYEKWFEGKKNEKK